MQFYFMEYVGNLIYKCQFNNTGENFSLTERLKARMNLNLMERETMKNAKLVLANYDARISKIDIKPKNKHTKIILSSRMYNEETDQKETVKLVFVDVAAIDFQINSCIFSTFQYFRAFPPTGIYVFIPFPLFFPL